jgi:hypothetical protein
MWIRSVLEWNCDQVRLDGLSLSPTRGSLAHIVWQKTHMFVYIGMVVCASGAIKPQIDSHFASNDLGTSCVVDEGNFYCATEESSALAQYKYSSCIDLTSSAYVYHTTSILVLTDCESQHGTKNDFV